MIYLISGNLGVGKTAFAVCRALDRGVSLVLANFDISGLRCPFIRLPPNPEDWGALPFVGYPRNLSHPKVICILDEMPEIADQFSRKNSALLSYLRHSDKIGHTVYIISQRHSHSNKTVRDLAGEIFLLFFVLGKRMYIRINGQGKPCSVPRPLHIQKAFGHYDTSAIVSPHIDISPRFLPLRKYRFSRSIVPIAALYFFFALICILAFLYVI